jgi:hypothetical protein
MKPKPMAAIKPLQSDRKPYDIIDLTGIFLQNGIYSVMMTLADD